VGFNNNVRHRDRMFHIQTEDSGVLRPHINTHLFVDGGRIIKSMRTDYSAELGTSDLHGVVRSLMKKQHKAMFLALRGGTFDALIDQLGDDEAHEPLPRGVELGATAARPSLPRPPESLDLPATTSMPVSGVLASLSPHALPAASGARPLAPVPPPPLPSFDRHIPTPLPPPLRSPVPLSPIPRALPVVPPPLPAVDALRPHTASPSLYEAGASGSEGPPPPSSDIGDVPPQRPPKGPASSRRGRPTALSDVKPNAQSIFGVAPSVREQSLDNAIQSYLSDANPIDPPGK
jgi:hypothetical protein